MLPYDIGEMLNVGDSFYKIDSQFGSKNPIVVKDMEERLDDDGQKYWIITGEYANETIGGEVRKFDSRMLTPNKYIIRRRNRTYT